MIRMTAAQCVSHAVDIRFDAAKSYEPKLAVVFPSIDFLHNLVGENRGRGEKRNAVLRNILGRLVLVPLELQFIHLRPVG